jgi:SPW repeat
MAKATMKHWQDPVNLVLGLWLIVSPWILGFQAERASLWSAVILGILVAATALTSLFRVRAWEEWANVVLGVCLIICPWVLRFTEYATPTWNAVFTGIIIAALALWALGTDKDIGGWWTRSPAT